MTDDLVVCPRCGAEARMRFYGPCDDCREALRAVVRRSGPRRRGAQDYEPKMNVTPNAVASKD